MLSKPAIFYVSPVFVQNWKQYEALYSIRHHLLDKAIY